MSRQRPTGERNVFKIKSGGFTYVIRSSGSDRRLTERIFCIHYFGMVLERLLKYFTTIMLRALNVVKFHLLMFVCGYTVSRFQGLFIHSAHTNVLRGTKEIL